MAKTLDLNALDQPILEVKLRDENRTIFRLTIPTTKLVERFVTIKDEVSEILKTKDVTKIAKLYEFTAELISCNADYITVTADELREKYRLALGDIVVVFAAYLDFLNEINTAKN